MKTIKISDAIIKIAENIKDNIELINNSNKDDIWFHLEKYPSFHLSLSPFNKNNVSDTIILQASILCKQSSMFKNFNDINVIYTKFENIYKDENNNFKFTIKEPQTICI
jgi:predicted ribosome quality control (RQC) complex YloA/Tae2 family protein